MTDRRAEHPGREHHRRPTATTIRAAIAAGPTTGTRAQAPEPSRHPRRRLRERDHHPRVRARHLEPPHRRPGHQLPHRQRAGGRGLERLLRHLDAARPGARRPEPARAGWGRTRSSRPTGTAPASGRGRTRGTWRSSRSRTTASRPAAGSNGTSLALPHGLGHGWAAVLWDLNWDLIDKYGFNPNLYGAWNSGGNLRAIQYVTDGLKLQGCGPGLVVARDAIIAAADALTDGADTCTRLGDVRPSRARLQRRAGDDEPRRQRGGVRHASGLPRGLRRRDRPRPDPQRRSTRGDRDR